MTAAAALWTDDPSRYGATPLTLFCAPALSDREDDPPHYRSAMPQDDNDSRHAETIAPDAVRDTERPTNPESSPLPLPPPPHVPRVSDTAYGASVDQLLRMYQASQERDHDLLDPDGKLAQLYDLRAERVKRETVAELGAVVEQIAGEPMRELAKVQADIAESLRQLTATVVDRVLPQLERHDRVIAELRSDVTKLGTALAAVTDRIAALEKQDAHDAQGPAAPPASPVAP